MKKLLLLLLMAGSAWAAPSWTEFYSDAANGSDLNSGSSSNAAATSTFSGGTFVRSTGVYTCATENPILSNIVVNVDFASVYTTSGATTSTCIALVTGTNATTITLSTTVLGGATANVSETANAASLRIGGAWAGPGGTGQRGVTNAFPFNFVTSVMTNNPGIWPRVNFRNNAAYSVTNTIAHALNGPVRFQGYTAAPGDGGRATIIDAGLVSLAFASGLFANSGANIDYVDFVFSPTNWTSGNSYSFNNTGNKVFIEHVVISWARAFGISMAGTGGILKSCEAYSCNRNGSANQGGYQIASGNTAMNCTAHDCTNANSVGFEVIGYANLMNCIAYGNTNKGFHLNNVSGAFLKNCSAYNNLSDGFDMASATAGVYALINCNAVKNGGWGINASGSISAHNGLIINTGFGSGTMANGAGDIVTGLQGLDIRGSVSYTANTTPWVDPANGNFTTTAGSQYQFLTSPNFIQTTVNSPTNTVSYSSIGATSPTNSPAGGAAGGTVGYGFAQ